MEMAKIRENVPNAKDLEDDDSADTNRSTENNDYGELNEEKECYTRFKEEEEMKSWDGSINYISHHSWFDSVLSLVIIL